ncbi:MAG: RHS repeat-associated protein, partial [Kiritimatiellia bacterium]
TNGTPVATREYTPFGQTLSQTGPQFTHWFSTKPQDPESTHYAYTFRCYNPTSGRWLSRDPIAEKGGMNIYAMSVNATINKFDPLGLALYAFDGTWNHPNQKDRGFVRPTNIRKMATSYTSGDVFYYRGIGNEEEYGKVMQTIGGATGLGGRSKLEEAYWDLVAQYNDGDHVIDVIGFSRGSAMALEFANMIKRRGIPDLSSQKVRWVRRSGGKGRRRKVFYTCRTKSPEIRFVGVYDVVAAMGLAKNIGPLKFQKWNLMYDLSIPDNVKNAYHAMGLDESRDAFDVTRVPGADETWFRGVHSNIGSGYADTGLSDTTLLWMMQKATGAGLEFDMDSYAEQFGAPQPNPQGELRDSMSKIYDEIQRAILPGDRVHSSVDRSLYPRMPNSIVIEP